MFQHALDDAICTPPVFGDLFQIPGEHLDRFIDLGPLVVAECGDRWSRGLFQLVEKFDRQPAKLLTKFSGS